MNHLNKYFSLLLVTSILFLTSCHVVRFFTLNVADIKDYKRFPSYRIDSSQKPFCLTEKKYQPEVLYPDNLKYSSAYAGRPLEDFLDKMKTTAFIIVRNDTILFEKYFRGFNEESVIASFSVAKSAVSALTGIAIKEGLIDSVNDSITKYIDIFRHPGFDKITIEDCLNMRSGIRFNEGYFNPFGEVAKFYYGKNLQKYVSKLRIEEPPDQCYCYIGANAQILAMIIEKASKKKLHEYFEEKIWIPMGSEYSASWNYDSKKHGNIKAFCCLNARLRDFARMGMLYTKNSPPILSQEWISSTTTIDRDSRDSQGYPYSYFWRVMGEGKLFAKGILGQFIYIDTNKNIIIARFGKKAGNYRWPDFLDSVAGSL